MSHSLACLPTLAAAFALGFVADSAAQEAPQPGVVPGAAPHRCLTPARDPTLPIAGDNPDCGYNQTNPTAQYAPTSLLRIPVVFHVITRTNGTGSLSNAQIQSQVDILNEDYRALAGTPGANGTDSMIEFFLATTDPSGNSTSGITRSANNTWFSDGGGYWNTLAWDTTRYLNVYTNSASGALGYVPALPQAGTVLGTNADRVVVLWDSVGRNAPGGPPYNQGRTLSHEVGHYLGLFHTFDGGCGSATSCYVTGDLICDTNPEASPNFGCPLNATSCGSLDPVQNYMNYTYDACMTGFTPEQARRMRCTIQSYRPNLANSCAAASSTLRNAGPNPQIFNFGTPRLGANSSVSVFLGSTSYQFAVVYGFIAPADVTLSNGYHLLLDVNSPQVFFLPPLSGFFPGWNVTVPNNPGLCGLPISTQAFLFGGVPGFVPTNAQDLVVGT